jgi:pimeloyl-ACP methyl ester carboxylesterase
MPAVDLGSHTLWYDEHGSGQPLLLIPGLGASRLSWASQIDRLSPHFRLLVIDNRDAGDSALGTSQYSIADLADDAAALLGTLRLSSAHVMGWSMGGAVAQEMIDRHPARVTRLGLVATTPGGKVQVPPPPAMGPLLSRTDTETIAARVRRTYPHLAAPGYMDAHPKDLDAIVGAQESKPMSNVSYRRQLSAMVGWPGIGSAGLARISVPTLVIHGDLDPLLPYPNGRYLASHVPGALLHTYHGVGHLPPIEAVERFGRDAVGFFSAASA